MGILVATFKALKFPLKLLTGLIGRRRKKPKKTKLEQKQLAHVRNFDPTRLNNRSWQRSSGRDKKRTKKQQKHCQKKQKILN